MKKLVNVLIGVAAVSVVIGVISRLSLKPVSGIQARAMVDFAMVLLLFAIAISVKK